jgi:hypothetical protein
MQLCTFFFFFFNYYFCLGGWVTLIGSFKNWPSSLPESALKVIGGGLEGEITVEIGIATLAYITNNHSKAKFMLSYTFTVKVLH